MGLDDKVLRVAATDPRMAHLRDIEDVSKFDRQPTRPKGTGLKGAGERTAAELLRRNAR